MNIYVSIKACMEVIDTNIQNGDFEDKIGSTFFFFSTLPVACGDSQAKG